MFDLSKFGIRVAPISNRIVLARFGADPRLALDTRDIMSEFWQALVQYGFGGKMPEPEQSIETQFGGGDEQFSIKITRLPIVVPNATKGDGE